eukprot:11061044-Prorocentrum_lima.AAC.1
MSERVASVRVRWRVCRTGARVMAKRAAERGHPCVTPVLWVKRCWRPSLGGAVETWGVGVGAVEEVAAWYPSEGVGEVE